MNYGEAAQWRVAHDMNMEPITQPRSPIHDRSVPLRRRAHADRALWRRAVVGAARRSAGPCDQGRAEGAGRRPEARSTTSTGCANQAGEDNRNVARMAALLAGLPYEVPGVTVNRLCGSGLEAVGTAARAVRAGEAESSSPAASRA